MIRRVLAWMRSRRPTAPSTAEELAEAKRRAREVYSRVEFLEQYLDVLQRRQGGRHT